MFITIISNIRCSLSNSPYLVGFSVILLAITAYLLFLLTAPAQVANRYEVYKGTHCAELYQAKKEDEFFACLKEREKRLEKINN
jgi:hypothetical protein